MVPISVQLYSLRDACKDDFDAVLTQLAEIGFAGVEPFNLFGKSPTDFLNQIHDLGMRVSSTHTPWVNRTESTQEVVDVVQALGQTRAPGGFMPDDFKDRAALDATIEATQGYVDALKPHGLNLFLHNHWWEFAEIDGKLAYHHLQDAVPDVQFELDTYWAANFGACDPKAELSRIADRTPLLHIKDGPLIKGESHVAVGSGTMNIHGLFDVADPNILEWAVVELDACDTDMMTAVAESYTYLTNNNLAQGNV
jgi:sugar phosphate isomerase/epimerase